MWLGAGAAPPPTHAAPGGTRRCHHQSGWQRGTFLTLFFPPPAPHSSHFIQSNHGFTSSVKKSDGHLERQEALRPEEDFFLPRLCVCGCHNDISHSTLHSMLELWSSALSKILIQTECLSFFTISKRIYCWSHLMDHFWCFFFFSFALKLVSWFFFPPHSLSRTRRHLAVPLSCDLGTHWPICRSRYDVRLPCYADNI